MAWRPEVEVDEALARDLIRRQFPELDRVEPLGQGWDYSAFRVDDEYVFRFPRRAVVLPGMEREIATLSRLSLPVAVPVPLFVGEATRAFPWRFYGARFIDGEEPLNADEERRGVLSMDLARTLRALHSHDPGDLPEDANRRADMARRVPWARAALHELGVAADNVLAQADDLGSVPATSLCHGDLHVRQLICGEHLNGIIDWVDICRANAAIDLSLLWSFVPRDLFDAFMAEYGPVDDAQLLIARVLALGLSATLANYARDVGHEALERDSRAAVQRALQD